MNLKNLAINIGAGSIIAAVTTVTGTVLTDGPSDSELAHAYSMGDQLDRALTAKLIERMTAKAIRKVEACYD